MTLVNALSTPRSLALSGSPMAAVAQPRPVSAPLDSFERVNGNASTQVQSATDQVYAQLVQARNVGGASHLGFAVHTPEVTLRQWVDQAAKRHSGPVTGELVVEKFNELKMRKLHGKSVEPKAVVELMVMFEKHQQSGADKSDGPRWAKEELFDPELGRYEISTFMDSFKKWVTENDPVSLGDLGVNFSETQNNSISVLSDKEDFWPVLMKDLESAEHSVNINVFGLMGDEWGKEVFDLLIDKANKGVKVRVMADSLGARMHWYFGHKNEDFIQHLRDSGIEVIITSDDKSGGNFHFDHRKFFVIDGKLAHNTGYTIEEHMRKIHFDMGMRIQGDMVNQMQASFFASWMHWGGKIEEAQSASGYDKFMTEYFPKIENDPGESAARLLLNIPRVQHRATESYYEAVSGAKEKISVINEFLSDNELMDRLYEKAEAGVEVELLFPRECEWEGYRFIAYEFFDKMKKFPNVKAYLYDGPQNTGWLHTKGIAIDGNYINFGSTNMDELSLYHNYEQNIETRDPQVVKEIQEKIFDYAIMNSTPYNEEPSWGRSLKTFFYKLFKKVIEP